MSGAKNIYEIIGAAQDDRPAPKSPPFPVERTAQPPAIVQPEEMFGPFSNNDNPNPVSVAPSKKNIFEIVRDSHVPRLREEGGPGMAKSFARGLTVGTGGGLAELAGHGIDAIEGVASKTLGLDTGMDFSGDMGERARSSIDSAMGIPEPVSGPEKSAQAAGEATGYGLLAAPIIASGAGVPAAIAETALAAAGGFTGEEARQAAEEKGIGELGQGGASVLGDMAMAVAAPAVFVANAPKNIDRARRFIKAIEASPEVQKAAAKMGVSVNDFARGSSEWKSLFDESPYGDERYIDEAAEALEDAARRFNEETMPTTRQILESEYGDSGAALAGMEEKAGELVKGFGPKVAGKRRAARVALSDELESIRPDGSVEVLSDTYKVARGLRDEGVEKLWAKVNAADMPDVDARNLKRGAMESYARAGEFEQDVPEEVLKILEWPDTVPYERFQRMRSRIERSKRLAEKSLGETAAKHKASNLGPTRRAFNNELEVIGKNDPSGEYLNALKAKRKFEEDFNQKRPSIKAIEGFEDGPRIAKKILGAPEASVEARNVMRLMEGQENGVDSFRRIMFDEIAGGEINPGRSKTILKNLEKHEKALIEVFGKERFDNMRDIFEKARIISVGKTGSSRQVASTGSGRVSALEVGMSSMDAQQRPAGMAASVVRKAMQKVLNNDVAMQRIFLEASLDPKMAALLLRMPTERALPAWVVNWNKLTKRAAMRTAARNATGDNIENGN